MYLILIARACGAHFQERGVAGYALPAYPATPLSSFARRSRATPGKEQVRASRIRHVLGEYYIWSWNCSATRQCTLHNFY